MTKEEILNKNVAGWRLAFTDKGHNAAMNAMDEYAKQQAVAFANYIHFNYQPETETGYWYDQHDLRNQYPITTEWIYNQFIEQQNK